MNSMCSQPDVFPVSKERKTRKLILAKWLTLRPNSKVRGWDILVIGYKLIHIGCSRNWNLFKLHDCIVTLCPVTLALFQWKKVKIYYSWPSLSQRWLQKSPTHLWGGRKGGYFRNYAPVIAIFKSFWYPDSQPKSKTGMRLCQVRDQRNTISLGCSSHKRRDLEPSPTLANITEERGCNGRN